MGRHRSVEPRRARLLRALRRWRPRTAHVGSAASAGAVALAWVCVAATATVSLRHAGAPTSQVAAYLLAWVVGSTLPGVLVWRALAGHSTVVRELGFGSVLGIVLQLLAWAVATSVHRPVVLAALPVGVVVLFTAVPGLRRHWWPSRTGTTRTPARWHLAMAVVSALAVYRFEKISGQTRALPPNPSLVYRDTFYNSALSYELSRTVRPQDPFVVGEPLRYHWFADAHVTATAQLSGAPVSTAMITLWLVPMLVVILLAVAAAAEHFLDGPRVIDVDGTALGDVRRWWAGPLAAFSWYVAPAMWRLGAGTAGISDGFVPTSPSGTLSLALLCCVAGPVLDLLCGRGRRRTWVVLLLLLIACSGTKPSLLPVIGFGAAVVVAVDLLCTRRVNRPMAYVLAASGVIAAVAAPFVTGSTGGSHVQLLALVTGDPSYERLLGGEPVVVGAGGWLVPALAERLPGAVGVVAFVLLISVLGQAPRLLALAGVVARPLRGDPALRWACGVLVGGYGAMWVLAHPAYGQHYFWTVTLALAAVLTVTDAVRLVPAARRARTLVAPAAVLGVPSLVLSSLAAATAGRVDLRAPTSSVVEGRLRPYALVLTGVATAVLLTLLLRRVAPRWSLPLLTSVTVSALAACVPIAVVQVRDARAPRLEQARVGVTEGYVSPEQQRAAVWLNRHSAPTSVVATNVFCWRLGQRGDGCDVNSMWLSGLSGRRMVLSDWTFSAATEGAYDGTRPLSRMPTPWPQRRRLSLEAVEDPTAQVLGRLRRDYGARWIFADRSASPISPRLGQLATLRYRSQNISIYRLADAYPS